MSTLNLHVGLLGGAHIENVARDMEALSRRLGIMVTADMNGVHLIMPMHGNAKDVVSDYDQALRKT